VEAEDDVPRGGGRRHYLDPSYNGRAADGQLLKEFWQSQRLELKRAADLMIGSAAGRCE